MQKQVETELRVIIYNLNQALEDAVKVDKGKAGEPGTRLRKAASAAQKQLKGLRDMVSDLRRELKDGDGEEE